MEDQAVGGVWHFQDDRCCPHVAIYAAPVCVYAGCVLGGTSIVVVFKGILWFVIDGDYRRLPSRLDGVWVSAF